MPRRTRRPIRLALIGAQGRMGREIEKLCRAGSSFKVVGRVGRENGWTLDPRSIDLVVDFSQPPGLRTAITWCVKHKKPLVSGTTGLKESDRRAIKAASRKIPLLYSANMSLGVAVMTSLLTQVAVLKDWDFLWEETHHTKKKDKPSGTAKLLEARLALHLGRSTRIISHRRGKVPGTHELKAMGPDETLVIRHVAHHRRLFARGAIRAARWLFDKKRPGLYDLSDLYASNI